MMCRTSGNAIIERIELRQFSGAERLARAAAERWLGPAAPVIRHVALSGGRIARLFLGVAAQMAVADATVTGKLRQTQFFWADERCVHPGHEESNFRLAKAALFDPLKIPESSIHRLQGELEPGQSVENANAEILRVVPRNVAGLPVFDLVILGMGEDGHVASLFPAGSGSAAFPESPYAVVVGPKPPNPRLTLTFPVLAAAREVWVLVSGEGKESQLRNALEGKGMTPIQRLFQLRDSTVVFVDRFILNVTPVGKVETVGK